MHEVCKIVLKCYLALSKRKKITRGLQIKCNSENTIHQEMAEISAKQKQFNVIIHSV